jgi:hypothetical protein
MSNTERSAHLAPKSKRFSTARRIPLATEGIPARPSARTAAAMHNPFASFAAPEAGAGRDMNAETKLYEVPRELIEIARARANGAEPAGKTTPLAPRPDAALQATLQAYTARLSTKPPRVPSLLLDEAVAGAGRPEPSPALELDPEARDVPFSEPAPAASVCAAAKAPEPKALELPVAPVLAPSVLERRSISRRAAVRDSARQARGAHPESESRAWMVYAALSLIGLASCAYVLLVP